MINKNVIINKAKEKLKQLINENSNEATNLVDKYQMPEEYKKADSSFIYGAASNYDKNIGVGKAYTLENVLKGAGRAGLLVGAIGLGLGGIDYALGNSHNISDVLTTAGVGLAAGAATGALIGPALGYYAGRDTEYVRTHIYNYKPKDSNENKNN